MIVFLDFEATSLSKQSVPIEVAWVFEDGRSQSMLIKPAPDWTDWSEKAQRIHGISRAELAENGVAVEQVVGEMLEVLSGHRLFASAPSWDGKWLSALLRAAGQPRHALRLEKSDEAFKRAARAQLGDSISKEAVDELVKEVIEETEPTGAPAHRALPDALLELERWKRVRQVASDRAADQEGNKLAGR